MTYNVFGGTLNLTQSITSVFVPHRINAISNLTLNVTLSLTLLLMLTLTLTLTLTSPYVWKCSRDVVQKLRRACFYFRLMLYTRLALPVAMCPFICFSSVLAHWCIFSLDVCSLWLVLFDIDLLLCVRCRVRQIRTSDIEHWQYRR